MIDKLVNTKNQMHRRGSISPSKREIASDEEEKGPTPDYVDSMAFELKSGGKKAYRSKMSSSQQSITSQSDYNDSENYDGAAFYSR